MSEGGGRRGRDTSLKEMIDALNNHLRQARKGMEF